MQNLNSLLSALSDFETNATREEKQSAVPALRRLSRKLEIQLMELLHQRLLLMQAESSKDRETLIDLANFSPFDEVKTWATEVLNPKPRSSGGLGFAVN